MRVVALANGYERRDACGNGLASAAGVELMREESDIECRLTEHRCRAVHRDTPSQHQRPINLQQRRPQL